MSETAFAQLTKTATELDYSHRVELLNLLAQSLYPDEIAQDKKAMNGLDEAIEEVKRGEYSTYDSFDELVKEIENEA